RWPVTPPELLSGLTQLRVFGLRRTMAMTAGQIAAAARAAGLTEVEVTVCGDQVIGPALRLIGARVKGAPRPRPANTPPPGCCYGRSTCSGGVASSITCSCARSARAEQAETARQKRNPDADRETSPGLRDFCSPDVQFPHRENSLR